MSGLARILAAWALALVALAGIGTLLGGGAPSFGRIREGLLGVGLVIGLPMLVFALVIAVPMSLALQSVRPIWLGSVGASLLCAAAAWLIASQIFPAGWRGAAQAFTILAAMLGLCWGLLGYLAHRPMSAI